MTWNTAGSSRSGTGRRSAAASVLATLSCDCSRAFSERARHACECSTSPTCAPGVAGRPSFRQPQSGEVRTRGDRREPRRRRDHTGSGPGPHATGPRRRRSRCRLHLPHSARREAAEIVDRIVTGVRRDKYFHEFTAERFEVHSDRGEVAAGIDGEPAVLESPRRFRIHHRRLRLLVPTDSAAAVRYRLAASSLAPSFRRVVHTDRWMPAHPPARLTTTR